MREYPTLNKLDRGETVEVEKVLVRKIEGSLQPGDLYVGERNQGPRLLTCKEVHPESWITPAETAYAYNTWECVRVERVNLDIPVIP